MKKLLLLALISAPVATFATTRTVCNTPSTLAQFSSIQAAVDASASGDTIYVQGSPNGYSAVNISGKTLAIYGPGFAPNKQQPLTAVVPGVTFSGNCDGSMLQGLVITGTVTIPSQNTSNYKIIRNYFQTSMVQFNCCNSVVHTGWLFQGNFFSQSYIQGSYSANSFTNWLVQNNIFYSNNPQTFHNFASCVNVLLDHNLFYGPSGGTNDAFANCQFLTLTNNIFIRRNAANGLSFATFNNNITYNAGNNTPWVVNSNSDAGGNMANTDPQTTDQSSLDAGVNNAVGNYTIAAGPANNAGSDGKDIGLLYDATGLLNWTRARNASLPFIFSMNVTNPTVQSGGNINVNVEARQND